MNHGGLAPRFLTSQTEAFQDVGIKVQQPQPHIDYFNIKAVSDFSRKAFYTG